MNEEILNYIYKEIGKSKIVELKGDASSRKYFRIIKNNNSYIVSDSSMEKKQFSYGNAVPFLRFTDIKIKKQMNFQVAKSATFHAFVICPSPPKKNASTKKISLWPVFHLSNVSINTYPNLIMKVIL